MDVQTRDSLLPYEVILALRGWDERRRAAQELYENGHPKAARVLREPALREEERGRVFVAKAMQRIADRHEAVLADLRERSAVAPRETGLLLALAEALNAYADDAVESRGLARQLRQEAEAALSQARRLDPGNPRLALALGKTLRGLGRRDDARRVLETVPSWHEDHARSRCLIAEIAFEQGRLEDVKKECLALKGRSLPAEARAAVAFWTDASPPVEGAP